MPRITEAEFTMQVIRLAQLYGWTVCHFRPAKTAKGYRTALQGDAGFPDIVAARNGRKIVAELKVGTRRATPEQMQWLAAWGADAFLWYPRDWDQIEAVFSGRL
jgi:hypothetical protein